MLRLNGTPRPYSWTLETGLSLRQSFSDIKWWRNWWCKQDGCYTYKCVRWIADTDKTRSILGRKLEMTIICLFWYTQEEDIQRQVIQLFQTGCFWINFRKLVCHPKQFELKHHQNSYQEHYLYWSIIKRGLVWLSSLWAVLILEDNFWLQKFFYQICWRCLFT